MELNLSFEKILPTAIQIQDLYLLLKKRKYFISHKVLPEFEEHKKFVLKNPYKYWYFVFLDKIKIGTFYIMFDNSIGINLIQQNQFILKVLIEYINNNFIPEEPKFSLVPNYFYVNISSQNKELREILNNLKIPMIQISYKI